MSDLTTMNDKQTIDFLVNQVKELRKERADLLRQLNEREKPAANQDRFPLEEVSSITAGIVHDMRNGLGIIRNTAGFLQGDLGEEHESDLLKIMRSLDYCDLVLRNLSALGGKDMLQPHWVDLEATARDVFFMLENKLVDVVLNIDVESNLPKIMADEGQIKQIFMNLIKNAGEAMPDGGMLTFRAYRDGEMVQVEISDTGHGIAPENQARLFKQFFTTKERGYGLGLFIVYSIMVRHGGTIDVNSEVGKGTTFTLRLPVEAKE